MKIDILGFCILYIESVVISIVYQALNKYRLFRDAADCHYLIDIEKLSKLFNNTSQKKSNVMLNCFMPFYNFGKTLNDILIYNNNCSNMFNLLSVNNILVEMTNYEVKEYSCTPTIMKAVSMNIRYANLSDCLKIIDCDKEGNVIGKLYYGLDTKKRLQIYRAEGSYANMSYIEQLEKVYEKVKMLYEDYCKKKSDCVHDFNSLDNKKDLSRTERIEYLKQLRKELLNNSRIKKLKVVKGPKLVRKK